MLGIAPLRRLRGDVTIGALEERGDRRELGLLNARGCPLIARLIDRINAPPDLLARLQGGFAGLGEADGVDSAEPHLPGPTINHVPKNPRLRSGRGNLQSEAMTITIQSRFFGIAHSLPGELVPFSGHDRHFLLRTKPCAEISRILSGVNGQYWIVLWIMPLNLNDKSCRVGLRRTPGLWSMKQTIK